MSEGFTLSLPPEIVEVIARLAAEIVVEQLEDRPGEQWPQWMAPATAAKYIDVTPVALQHMKDRGVIPFVQEAPGCSIRYRRGDLDAYMAELRVEARRSAR